MMPTFTSRKKFIALFSGMPVLIMSMTDVFIVGFKGDSNAQTKPNFVVIFTDDQGYGDLGCYGHPTIRTPNIDRMAVEGQRWTNFYVAANVCTPSRAGLLTGRYGIRNGMYSASGKKRVLFPDSGGGLPATELTIAKQLQRNGYRTACVGKWHLGHLDDHVPTSHGFDYYFGIPYSNDMDKDTSIEYRHAASDPKVEYFNVPLMKGTNIVERPADQTTITKRYTEETIRFITGNKEQPFFIYLAHSMPHVPLFASNDFKGKSERGLYGDVIEEIDWSVGQILNTLRKEGLDKNTIVIFTSDNGPWVIFNEGGGSAGPLFGAKGTSYEGGQRVPAIFWGPGKIKPGVVSTLGSTLDIFPTLSKLAGIPLQDDRIYDGYDISPVFSGSVPGPRKEMIFYHDDKIFAARKGDYKMYYYSNNPTGYPEKLEKLGAYQLFNLQHDPSERFNIADKHPEVIKEIETMVETHQSTIEPSASQLDRVLVK
ncbi:MAG TPA: sulfatase [Chryseolinea sp.]